MFRIDVASFITAFYLLFYSSFSIATETVTVDNQIFDYTIGVCALIENPPIPPHSAVNGISPVLITWSYLTKKLKISPESITAEMYNNAKVNVLKKPVYGELDFDKAKQNAAYIPNSKDFYANDSSTLSLSLGHYKVQLLYSFKVLGNVPQSNEEYDPYYDINNCPNGRIWKM